MRFIFAVALVGLLVSLVRFLMRFLLEGARWTVALCLLVLCGVLAIINLLFNFLTWLRRFT